MDNVNTQNEPVKYMNVEESSRHSLSIHWRAVFTGLFISMLVYFTLVALGVGIGAGQVVDVIRGEDSASALGKGAGVWLALTVLVSLAMGSYASSRVSGNIVTRVGYIQGAVVAALFFTLMISQVGMAIGAVGQGVGAISSTIGGVARGAAGNPQINGIVEDALGDLNFKSSPEVVISGFVSRLARGNDDAAANYLAVQTGITRAEAATRYQELKATVQARASELGQEAARATRAAGLMAFALLLLGSISAMLGGAFGAQLNLRKPLDGADRKALRPNKPAYSQK